MRSQADPIRAQRQRLRRACLFGGAAVGLSALWAFRPLPSPVLAAPPSGSVHAASNVSSAAEPEVALDPSTFDVELWNPAPKAETAATNIERDLAPTRPFRLQLVGIVAGEDALEAALYDPEEDRLVVAKDGDLVAGHQVTRVTAKGVTFGSGRTTRVLRLEEGRR